ncbi:MAG: histidine kinase [Bacteroidota bacterium]
MGEQESQLILVIVTSTGIILLILGVVAVLVIGHQKRIMKQDLHLQQLQNDQQRELLRATIEGQERERERLAKELHDGFGSLLSGLRFHLKNQLRGVDRPSKQADFLEEACGLLDQGVNDLRRVSHNLLPVALASSGLRKALETWLSTVNQEDFRVQLIWRATDSRRSQALELSIFRILQELLHNTHKHADSQAAQIEVEEDREGLRITYSDDGCGVSLPIEAPGLGLKNIASRVQALSGQLDFQSAPGMGFRAIIQFPNN